MYGHDSYSEGISDYFYLYQVNENSENFNYSNSFQVPNDFFGNFQSTNEKSYTKEEAKAIEIQNNKLKDNSQSIIQTSNIIEGVQAIESQNNEQKEKNNPSSDNNTIVLNNDKNQNDNNCKNKEFIGKKTRRPIFITKNPQNSQNVTIFTNGDFDAFSKKMINDALNNNYKKKKISKNEDTNEQTNNIKNKKTRKYRTDEIINKFLGKFFKTTTSKLNEKLEIANSKKFFKNLPPCYIKNYKSMILTAKKSKKIAEMDYTLEKIFSTEFIKIEKKNKLINNVSTINYLKNEKNKSIYENSNYSIFKDIKLSEIFNQYFNSKEFGMEISMLKDQGQKEDYIKDFIFKVKKFFNPFYQ